MTDPDGRFSFSCAVRAPASSAVAGQSGTLAGEGTPAAGPSSSPAAGPSGTSIDQAMELTEENVEKVLDELRPYLMADGGNVEFVSISKGVVYLR